MRTLVLLAGRSTRFWPLSDKAFWPIGGKVLLQHQIERLKAAGCENITLICGAHNMKDAIAAFPDLPVVEQEDLEKGMQGALQSALPECGDEPVLIVNSNDVVDADAYKSVIDSAKDVDGALLAKRMDRYFPGGYLEVDGDRITSIIEKPGEGNEPSDLVTIVVHYHKNASVLLDTLNNAKAKNDDGYEQALASLFQSHTYNVAAYEGNWQAVKYPWHMLSMLELLLGDITEQSIASPDLIHPTAVIEGNVVLEEGVKVMAHATIVGPCYIGRNTVIANNALVRQSSVGANCVIGYSTEICRSILHSFVWTHTNYIGDSIVSRNVSLGSGAVAANLRLDEGEIASVIKKESIPTQRQKFGTAIGESVRIGVNTTISPGCFIGSQSMIGSNALIAEHVPDHSFARMKKGEVKISENTQEIPDPESRKQFDEQAGLRK